MESAGGSEPVRIMFNMYSNGAHRSLYDIKDASPNHKYSRRESPPIAVTKVPAPGLQ